MTAIKKLTFVDDLYPVLDKMCKYIDNRFYRATQGKKGSKIYNGFDSFKEFLIKVESDAIKSVAEELDLTTVIVKERWKILTMPQPVYGAIEEDEICISRLKLLTLICWDYDDDKDVEITQKLVDAIKADISASDLRAMIKEETKDMWHSSTIVMEHMALQNGINAKTVCGKA